MEKGIHINIDPHIFPPPRGDNFPNEFVRVAGNSISSCSIPSNPNYYPSFLTIRPIPPNVNIPCIDCRRDGFPRCGTCKGYLSPFVFVSKESQPYWRCPLCGHVSSCIHFTGNYDMTIRTDRAELHTLVYDCIPPREMEFRIGQSMVFAFVIDENLLRPNVEYYQELYHEIENLKNVVQDTDQICLITYSGTVTIYDLNTKIGTSFSEFDTNLYHNKLRKKTLINAKIGLPNLLKVISCISANQASHFPEKMRFISLYTALRYLNEALLGYGGKALLFTTGQATDSFFDSLLQFEIHSISLSVFKTNSNTIIEKWAQVTNGYIAPLNSPSLLQSLFTIPTCWDACLSLRTSSGATISSLMGGATINKNQAIVFPIIDQSQALTVELQCRMPLGQKFFFQFAFRFTDDKGVRKYRIINGTLPITMGLEPPIDEAAYSQYLLKKLYYEVDRGKFDQRIRFLTNLANNITPNGMPVLLASGKDWMVTFNSAVERLCMTVYPLSLKINETEFHLIFTINIIIIYPQPTDEQQQAIVQALTSLGLHINSFSCCKSMDEFNTFYMPQVQCMEWFNNILTN